jgi:hypothetical protein
MHPVGAPAMHQGGSRSSHLCLWSCRACGHPFAGRACPLSALVGTAAGSQCSSSNRWPGEDHTVRCSSWLCYLARPGDSLNRADNTPQSPFSSDGYASPSGGSCAPFPGFVSFPPCSAFFMLSICCSHLFRTPHPVQHSLHPPAKRLALQQPRCAIRGL